jgi:hypothetical protein
MKYWVTWRIHTDKRHEALKTFSQMTVDDDRKDLGPDVKLIGRWHDLASFEGLAIVETEKAEAIANWLLNWNHIIDTKVVPVLNDEECRVVGKQKLG